MWNPDPYHDAVLKGMAIVFGSLLLIMVLGIAAHVIHRAWLL